MNYTIEDIWSIKYALKESDPWSSSYIEAVKNKIKLHFREKQRERCCYCFRNTHGEFRFVLDIEHILPKSIFRNVIFDLENLAVSCKKCNMKIKKNRTDFVSDIVYLKTLSRIDKDHYFKSENYKIIHPNLDVFSEHIKYCNADIDGMRTVKYKYQSEKGRFTYYYFKLNEFEIDELDRAQGIDVKEEKNDDEIIDLFKSIYRDKILDNA